MLDLGYNHYFAQGGDWGSAVTTALGMQGAINKKGACVGIHVNMPNAGATKEALADPDESDKRALAGRAVLSAMGCGVF